MSDSDYIPPPKRGGVALGRYVTLEDGAQVRVDCGRENVLIASHAVVDELARELAACVEVLHMILMDQHGYTERDLSDTFAGLAHYNAVVGDG